MSICRGIFAALLIFLVLNIFASTTFAQQANNINTIQCIISGQQTSLGNCIASAIPISLIGIGVSLLILAISYMFGEVLNYQVLRNFYKRELWETAKSALIIVIVFSSLIIASSIAVSFAGNAPSSSGSNATITSNLANLYTSVNSSYLTPQLNDSYTSLSALFGLSVGTDFVKSMSLAIWLPIPIPTQAGIIGAVQFGATSGFLQSNYITAIAGDSFLNQVTSFSTSLVTSASALVLFVILSLQIQRDLLYTIAALGLGVFIPLGLVMRAMPFIRGIGGTMIAIGIGLAIVYPALLIGFNLPITNYMYTLTAPGAGTTLSCPFSQQLLCKTVWLPATSIVQAGTGLFTGSIPVGLLFGTGAASTAGTVAAGNGFYTGVLGPFGLIPGAISSNAGSGIFPALNFIVDWTINDLLQFLLFTLDIIIGVSITNAIAGLMGGQLTLGVGGFKLA
jgi:hypothetical protein